MIADRMRAMVKVESDGKNYLYDEGIGENNWVEGYMQYSNTNWNHISKEETYIQIYCYCDSMP